jgi:hypothetical protein
MSRLGVNPAKKAGKKLNSKKLEIIIPVFIPNHDGYFYESFKIFQLCLSSIHSAKSSPISVTIVLNGCAKDVVEFCKSELACGRIDNLIFLNHNVGKVNAILKGVAGSDSEIFIISDADVLFLSGFDFVINNYFMDNRSGFLGLQPVFKKSNYFTSITRLLLFSKLRRIKPNTTDREEHIRFLQSTGSSEKEELESISIVSINGIDCVLGSGHFCFATHRSSFENIPKLFSENLISGGSERLYLDAPSFYTGLLRLSVRKSVVLHMGNTVESWMTTDLNEFISVDRLIVNSGLINIPKRRFILLPKFIFKIIEKIF